MFAPECQHLRKTIEGLPVLAIFTTKKGHNQTLGSYHVTEVSVFVWLFGGKLNCGA
jgi:hypothetical protein